MELIPSFFNGVFCTTCRFLPNRLPEGKSCQFLLVGDLGILLVLDMDLFYLRQNKISCCYIFAFLPAFQLHHFWFLLTFSESKVRAIVNKVPESRCSFMPRIPSIRLLFHQFSSCWSVFKPIASLDQRFSTCSSSSGSQAFGRFSFPTDLSCFRFEESFFFRSSSFPMLKRSPSDSFQKISSQSSPVSSKCSRFVFFTFFPFLYL